MLLLIKYLLYNKIKDTKINSIESVALKRAVWVLKHESGPEEGRLGFRSQFISHYSHAHDERQLECASGKSLVHRPVTRRHSVKWNGSARRVAEFQHRQLMSIEGDGASLRRVVDVSPHPLEPRTTSPTKRCCMKVDGAHNIIL